MTDDLQTAIERCRDFAGPGWVDVENMPPAAVADLLTIARAYFRDNASLDTSDPERGPRYIAWVGTRQFYLCGTLAAALDWRSKTGATVYEPVGIAAAERVMRAAEDKS
jgi:hypothetical protein